MYYAYVIDPFRNFFSLLLNDTNFTPFQVHKVFAAIDKSDHDILLLHYGV